MFEIVRSAAFDSWLLRLKDKAALRQILVRLDRLALGHWGDCKAVGDGIVELRIAIGAGYRVYCWAHGKRVVIVLSAGDKSSQDRDIVDAKAAVKLLKAPEKAVDVKRNGK
jgi:putative addiction module killer protein